MPLLSEHQLTFFLFEYFDDHVINVSEDAILSARLLRTLQTISEPGLLLKILDREKAKKSIQILEPFENAAPETACVRLLDYVEVIK
jgi:hypothetical protein